MQKVFILAVLALFSNSLVLAQERQHKIIFDFTRNDTANFATVVRQAKNVMTAAPNAKVQIVCYGPGLDLLVKDKTTVQKEIEELQKKYGVAFAACEASMKRRNIDKSRLLPQAATVPFASLEISSKQQEGWSYIKAGH